MDKSLQQVCLTYLRSWVQWFVILLYFGICLIACCHNQLGRTYNHWVDVAPKPSYPGPSAMIANTQSMDRANRAARTIRWNVALRSPSPSVTAQPFPNVKTLDISGTLKSREDLQVLRSMPQLAALTFSSNLPSNGLQLAAELPQLQYLRVPRLENNRGLPQLRRLKQLQILDIGQVDGYARVLDEICQLHNLQTLVLPGQSAAKFQPADWERLRSLPSLKRLQLRGQQYGPIEDQIEINRVQQVLPHIKVRPAEVSRTRSQAWSLINGAGVLIWAAMAVQLHWQFSQANSRLIPHYSRDHLRVAAALMLGTTIMHSLILWSCGVSFSASLAGSLLAPGLLWGAVALTMRLSDDRQLAVRLNPVMALILLMQVPYLVPAVVNWFLADVDWFLQGRQPGLAWGIVVCCLIPPLLVFRRLPGLHAAFAECPAGMPPLALDLKSLREWNRGYANSQRGKQRSWFGRDPIARLDAVLAQSKSQSLARLWMAGNSSSGSAIARAVLRLCIVTAIVFFVILRPAGLDFNLDQSTVQFWGSFAAAWLDLSMLSALVGVWRARRFMLGYESLRPVSRQGFVRQLFLAVGRDLLPLVILHLLLAGTLVGMIAGRGISALVILVVLCYCLFHGLVIYASILLIMSVRGELKFGMLLGLMFVIIFFAATQVSLAMSTQEHWSPVWSIVVLSAGCVLAILSLLGLKHYWEDLELA